MRSDAKTVRNKVFDALKCGTNPKKEKPRGNGERWLTSHRRQQHVFWTLRRIFVAGGRLTEGDTPTTTQSGTDERRGSSTSPRDSDTAATLARHATRNGPHGRCFGRKKHCDTISRRCRPFATQRFWPAHACKGYDDRLSTRTPTPRLKRSPL